MIDGKKFYIITNDCYVDEIEIEETKFLGFKMWIITFPDGKIVKKFLNPLTRFNVFETKKQAFNSILRMLDNELRDLCNFREEQEIEIEKTEEMITCIKDLIKFFENKIDDEK